MTIINENTVVVFSENELKEVLEGSNSYSYIYFGNNITLSSGISIAASKQKITIDGTYLDITYEFTDQKKLGTTDTIRVISSSTQEVIVKNMKITGYNYYGIIYVPEEKAYQNISIEYNNIAYTGPQISFNPMGLTRFIDSTITIQDNYATGNEVAECNRIEIGGLTTITHKSTSNSSFWFRNSNPSFKILSDATVHFKSERRELFYGVNDLNLTIGKNAFFDITTYNGLAYGTNGTGATLIDENAKLSITKTNYSGSYATWYSYGTITLNKNSSLSMINEYPNITSSNYNIYFQGSNCKFILNNPEEVVLYNSTANVFNTTADVTFEISYSRINLFNQAISYKDDISENNIPTYSWYKDIDLSKVVGTFNNSKTTISENNYTAEELKNLPDLSNFNFANKKILSIGTIPLYIHSLTDQDTTISGITGPQNSILITYDDKSNVVVADESGEFTYSYSTPLPVGTIITFIIKKYNSVIYYTKQIQIVYSGELTLDSATKYFRFEPIAIQENPTLCPRLTDVVITITDSRVNSSNWNLYATIDHDLTSEDGLILEDSLVYVKNGQISVLSETPTLIYTGESNQGQIKITNVHWEEDEGILLQLKNPLQNKVEYKATITWILEE